MRRSYAQATGPEWSGESGGSGHPLMQADAIRAVGRKFSECLQGLYPAASKRGIQKQAYDTYTRDLTPDLRIMDLVDAQPEFTSSFWDYLDILVGEERIRAAARCSPKTARPSMRWRSQYGVDRYVIAAIWGIESKYSTMMGERSVRAFDRDARLCRAPAGLFPQRISRRGRDDRIAATCSPSA